ncbi:MAG: RDD family protein, partial [Thermoleophilaceae bacterium]
SSPLPGLQPPPAVPQAPPVGPPAPPGPEAAPGYGGPVPPSGWQQPIAPARSDAAWVGQPLASWGSRVAAAIIDGLIISIPAVALFLILVGGSVGITGGDDDASAWAIVGVSFLWVLIVAAIALLYAPATMARQGEHNGQTWGKQLIGIRVLHDHHDRMTFAWAALREVVIKFLLVGIASSIIPVLPWLLDILWPLWDDENRALHDMIVQTHVVKA